MRGRRASTTGAVLAASQTVSEHGFVVFFGDCFCFFVEVEEGEVEVAVFYGVDVVDVFFEFVSDGV